MLALNNINYKASVIGILITLALNEINYKASIIGIFTTKQYIVLVPHTSLLHQDRQKKFDIFHLFFPFAIRYWTFFLNTEC